jgi:hypothetical protein
MPKGVPIQQWQFNYIEQYHKEKTVEELAKAVGLSIYWVYTVCYERRWNYKRQRSGVAFVNYIPSIKEKVFIPDKPKQGLARPPAVYTNSPSPYGIADQLHNY